VTQAETPVGEAALLHTGLRKLSTIGFKLPNQPVTRWCIGEGGVVRLGQDGNELVQLFIAEAQIVLGAGGLTATLVEFSDLQHDLPG